jgi:hypothetical protein
MPFHHLMTGFADGDAVKDDGKIIIIRVQLTGGDLQFQAFMVDQLLLPFNLDADFVLGVGRCVNDTDFPLRINNDAVADSKLLAAGRGFLLLLFFFDYPWGAGCRGQRRRLGLSCARWTVAWFSVS